MNNPLFFFSGFLDLLCPPICAICGQVIENPSEQELQICSPCLQKIVTPDGKFCLRCGGRRFVTSNHSNDCPRCRTTPYRFRRVITLGEYEHDFRLYILQMKTAPTGLKAISAAKALAHFRKAELKNAQSDFIMPVPMHRTRRKDRGVNSPDLIAEELGVQLRIPVFRNFVRRVRRTDLQYTLSRRGRSENVDGAFALRAPTLWETLLEKLSFRQIHKRISDKNILLVDDILTTGATCNEITKILLAAGVRSVTVAVLARAEGSFVNTFST